MDNSYLTIGAIIAALTVIITCGEKIKNIFWSIQSLWLANIQVDKLLSSAIYKHCKENMSIIKLGSLSYIGNQYFLKSKNKENIVALELLYQNTVIFRKKWKFIIASPGKWMYNSSSNTYERLIAFYFPRFMWNTKKFLKKIISDCETYTVSQKRFCINKFYGKNKNAPTINLDDTKRPDHKPNTGDELLNEVRMGRAELFPCNINDIYDNNLENPFEWYLFPEKIMKAVGRAKQWLNSRSWYNTKHIPWHRGWLLYGGPGTGKTLLLKCLAQYLDLPVFVFDLASMSNEEFVVFWNKCCNEKPCMILFEDFDAIFDKRKNIINETNGITFDCLLNCMSGIEETQGIFLGITTNNINKIDEALGINYSGHGISTRPGRIDEVIEMENLNEECRQNIAQKILDKNIEQLKQIIDDGKNMTAAQFVEFCSRIALESKYERT